ncbi:hypothetical protein LCGC14_2111190 [marine sediment metagenome]|uniref:DegT/DnrJ/EryC1/StrS aminotransferase family protein n=1 Tax=marine sediment metagenome TaxID=412755 RepID=A0A0F9E743_9ZZZZ
MEEKLNLIKQILESGNLNCNHGLYVELFEHRITKYVNSKYAIAVNSGTAALHTALLALDIGHGDEVIVPAWTFISTVSAVVMCGATPVFADISENSFNLDQDSILEKITPKTKAVIIVHLNGIPMDFTEIGWILYDDGIAIIEDACQALGAELCDEKVGIIGDIGVYSFYPSKIITTGEGGMIVTNKKKLAKKCRLIKDHGRTKHFYAERLGFNYRMTEIQGALGCVELKDIDKRIEDNVLNYSFVKMNLKSDDIKFPKIPKNTKIAPTYINAWRFKFKKHNHHYKKKETYTPIYKLPPFKQDIELKWTEYAAKFGVFIDLL